MGLLSDSKLLSCIANSYQKPGKIFILLKTEMQKINSPLWQQGCIASRRSCLSMSTAGQTLHPPNPKFSHDMVSQLGFREGDLVNEIKMLAVVSKILCLAGVEAVAISSCMRSRPC